MSRWYVCSAFAVNTAIVSGVGSNKPEPVPLVRRSDIGSSQHSPPAVIPERGQVTEDSSKSSSNEGWAVLHEDEAGSNFANDPRHVGPHAGSLSVNAGAFSGNADVLARKPSSHDVNNSAPRSSVKSPNVIPNRERREKAVVLSLGKNSGGVGLPLNSADASVSEHLPCKQASTSAREKMKLIHFSPFATNPGHRCSNCDSACPTLCAP
jgi:hypothetical protein